MERKHDIREQGGLIRPVYRPGDWVRTRVGGEGDRAVRTPLVSRVRSLMWHADRGQWVYFLEGNSRRRHRWYLAADLETVTSHDAEAPERMTTPPV